MNPQLLEEALMQRQCKVEPARKSTTADSPSEPISRKTFSKSCRKEDECSVIEVVVREPGVDLDFTLVTYSYGEGQFGVASLGIPPRLRSVGRKAWLTANSISPFPALLFCSVAVVGITEICHFSYLDEIDGLFVGELLSSCRPNIGAIVDVNDQIIKVNGLDIEELPNEESIRYLISCRKILCLTLVRYYSHTQKYRLLQKLATIDQYPYGKSKLHLREVFRQIASSTSPVTPRSANMELCRKWERILGIDRRVFVSNATFARLVID
ncbi:unnamed protein product [Soboliphyme baturini]|uniref:PDZ domain-containing protein n=1 Tax=Soboliphyme baturini TaxID=241478 RepID=A0A183IIE7_9BILA|nr:unnamed protein product [Soboliphyme baturini]